MGKDTDNLVNMKRKKKSFASFSALLQKQCENFKVVYNSDGFVSFLWILIKNLLNSQRQRK